ncbi:MAG: MaoC family dehydratase [Rhizobiaceae bacterium]|nr:MaoC family dehydratase [Rhizobiaceae bacterium]
MSDIRYWLEDFTPGRMFHPAPRTVTSGEIVEFAREFDPQPFHLSEEAGKASILGGLAASGWHSCSIAMRLFYDTILQFSAGEGSPGIDLTEWRRPVLAGDTLAGTIAVLEARPMRSRPGLGIVRLRHELRNQRDELVLVMEHPFIVKARTEAAA